MAVGTAAVALTDADWTTLGAAPAILQVTAGSALVAVATAKPALNAAGISLPSGSRLLEITGTGALWARAVTKASRIVVATLA